MADKTTSLKIQVDLEAQKAAKEAGVLDQSIDDVVKSAGVLNEELKDTEKAVESAAKDIAGLEAKTESAGKAAQDAAADFAILGGKSIADLRKKAAEAESAFKRLEESGEHSLEEISRAGKLLDKQLEEIESEINDVDRAIDKVDGNNLNGLKSSIGASIAAVASLQTALQGVQFFAEFDDELRRVKAFTKASGEEFERLKQLAIDLGREGGQTPRDIAAGMVDLAQSGSNVNDILRQTSDVALLAAGTELTFAEASDAVTDQMAQFGLETAKTGEVVDTFITATLSAGQNSNQFAGAMSYVGGIANQLGEDMQDTAAAITLLADASLKGERGGTGLRGVLAALVSKEDDLAEFGVKVRDAAGNFRELDDIVGDLSDANLGEQTLIKIFGIEAWPAVAALLAAGEEGLESYEAKFKDIAGTGKEVATVLQEGVGGAIRSLTSDFQVATLEAVEPFEKALNSAARNDWTSRAANLVTGNINLLSAGVTQLGALVLEVGSYGESLSDALTGDDFNEWGESADSAWESASDLAAKAVADFKQFLGIIDPVVEAQKDFDAATNRLADEFEKLSKETGVTVKSMADLDAAVAAGKLVYDDAAGAYVSAEKKKQNEVKRTAEEAAEAAKKAEQAEKKARKAARKEWEDWHKVVKGLLDDIVEREQDLAAELKEMERSAMSAADAQKAIKKEAKEAAIEAKKLADEAKRLQEAGDTGAAQRTFEQALQSADAAKEAWGSVAGNVRSANEELKKSQEELKKARKEYKELSAAAKKDGIIDEKEKDKLKDARKEISELKKEVKENGKALKEEKKALEEAMTGVEETGKLGIDILKEQKKAAEENEDALGKAFNFEETKTQLNQLIDGELQNAADKAAGVGPALADGIKDGVDAGVDDAKRLEDALDAAAKDRTASFIITERTVQAALHGAQIMGRDMRAGAMVSGPVGYDSVYAILAGREAVTRNEIVDELGYNETFRPLNQGRYDIVMKRLAAFHGPDETREILSAYLRPPEVTMPLLPEMPRLDPPAQGGASGRHEFPHLGTIILQNDRTGDKFPVFVKPGDSKKLAGFLDDPAIKRHGQGQR